MEKSFKNKLKTIKNNKNLLMLIMYIGQIFKINTINKNF